MVVYTQSELEGLLQKTLKIFCQHNFVFNQTLRLEAVVKFKIDNNEEMVCTVEDEFAANTRTRACSLRVLSRTRQLQNIRDKKARKARTTKVNDRKECAQINVKDEPSHKQPSDDTPPTPEENTIATCLSSPDPHSLVESETKVEPDLLSSPEASFDGSEESEQSDSTELQSREHAYVKQEPSEKPKHACSFCGKVYLKPNRLATHERTHTGERPYSCLKCGKTFRSVAGHKNHKKKGCVDKRKKGALELLMNQTQTDLDEEDDEEDEVPKSKRKVCQYCGRRFAKPSRLIIHERTHSGERPFRCSCGRGYVSRQGLKGHRLRGCEDKRKIRTKSKKPPPEHPCSYCGKVYRKRNRLLIHERTKHTGERPFLCATCGKSYASKMTLNQHSLIHTKEKSYECTICKAKFLLPYTLKVHMRVHTGERPHICWHCGRAFRQYGSFQVHLRTHTKEKPLKCTMCDQRFAHRSILQKHEMMHLGDRQFDCHQCEKKFWTAHELKTHQKTHLGIRKHVCPHCNMRFTQVSSLKRHVEGHTGNNKVHHCPICGKSFTRSHQVTIHMKVHVPESPYRCQICGSTFKSMTIRKVHMKTHHGDELLTQNTSEQVIPQMPMPQQQLEQQSQQHQQPPAHIDVQTKLTTEELTYTSQLQPQDSLQQQQPLPPTPTHDLTFTSQVDHFPQSISQALNHVPDQALFHHAM